MKRLLLFLLLAVFTGSLVFASEGPIANLSLNQEKIQLIERNLIIGLESNIPTLQASAALVLRQVKAMAPQYEFSLGVIPLLRLVRTEGLDATVRMAAALALHDLNSARGDFAIARIAKYEDNPRVKKLFQALTYDRGLENILF